MLSSLLALYILIGATLALYYVVRHYRADGMSRADQWYVLKVGLLGVSFTILVWPFALVKGWFIEDG